MCLVLFLENWWIFCWAPLKELCLKHWFLDWEIFSEGPILARHELPPGFWHIDSRTLACLPVLFCYLSYGLSIHLCIFFSPFVTSWKVVLRQNNRINTRTFERRGYRFLWTLKSKILFIGQYWIQKGRPSSFFCFLHDDCCRDWHWQFLQWNLHHFLNIIEVCNYSHLGQFVFTVPPGILQRGVLELP